MHLVLCPKIAAEGSLHGKHSLSGGMSEHDGTSTSVWVMGHDRPNPNLRQWPQTGRSPVHRHFLRLTRVSRTICHEGESHVVTWRLRQSSSILTDIVNMPGRFAALEKSHYPQSFALLVNSVGSAKWWRKRGGGYEWGEWANLCFGATLWSI